MKNNAVAVFPAYRLLFYIILFFAIYEAIHLKTLIKICHIPLKQFSIYSLG